MEFNHRKEKRKSMKKLVVALLTIFCISWAGRSNKDCYANEKNGKHIC